MATEQISFYVSNRAFGCWNLPNKICSQSWSDLCQKFNFRSHISAICSSCIYHIRDLQRTRHHLDLDSAKLPANALVSSRLDYCNSLLSGIAETDLTKLQCILNRLARVVTKSPPFTCSVPLLRSLRWLPVKYSPFQDLLADLQGSSWRTTCLPSLLDRYFSSITLTEIKPRNHSLRP